MTARLTMQIKCGFSWLLKCHLEVTLNTGLVDITFDRYISR